MIQSCEHFDGIYTEIINHDAITQKNILLFIL